MFLVKVEMMACNYVEINFELRLIFHGMPHSTVNEVSYCQFRKGFLSTMPCFDCAQINTKIGPSGVRALPLAAGRNEGAHYFRYFLLLLLLLVPLFKTPEGVLVGFRNFGWAPN